MPLRHGALAAAEGKSFSEARLTDQQRLAVLLQGVAVLGHLERLGSSLAGGWNGARISSGGRLTGLVVQAGADRERPQRRAEELLLALFQAESSIAGRGEARRVARRLCEVWRQDIASVGADRLVAQLMDAAPLLWLSAFGEARAALAAEIEGGRSRLLVTGPQGFRRRLLEMCDDLAALQSFLATDESQRLWNASRGTRDPLVLVEAGKWRRAIDIWTDQPPQGSPQRLGLARALYAVGRFEGAKKALHGLRRDEARILRLGCQLRLGELAAAKRALKAWQGRRLGADLQLDLAAIAVRLFASLGEPESAQPWIDQALASDDPVDRQRARLLAGESAWDRGDQEELVAQIEGTTALADDSVLSWRRSHLQGLLAMARGDGDEVVEHLGRALASRRLLRPFEAAGLWNDLAVGRSLRGDLAGAERALRHVVRLTDDTEGDRRLTLALCNLAEIRLRRGELKGFRDVLRRTTRTNSQAGNWRGWAQDRELEVRFELVRGRPGGALAGVEETIDRLDERNLEWRRGPLLVLAARAHGWLGDVSAARSALAGTTVADRGELEPEERAPLLALSGDREGALEENPLGPCRDLWQQLLTGAAKVDWAGLSELEPYRAARLVFDAELVAPGRAPKELLRRAAAGLRAVGADNLAEQLIAGDEGPWLALEEYVDGSGSVAERLERLMASLSPEARLTWRDEESEVELVTGVGGAQRVERPFDGGVLLLTAPQVGAHERIALALAQRDLPAGKRDPGPPRRGSRHGMIGESTPMIEALDRLSKLASRDLPILIFGETGTGKELAAKLVHTSSRRAANAFLPVNCAALAESILLSELFGHVKGAFTGADRDRAGIFEAARGGTVLLDEIGDLPLLAQGKLLRVLQEKEVRRVGESIARPVDVRIVAATHHDLEAMVGEGAFRQDLFYRLSVGRVSLPPLAERGQDLLLLMEHFLAELGAGAVPRLSQEARAMLTAHSWPGNVRELSNVLTVAVALADGGDIEPRHLDLPAAPRAPRGGYHEQVEAFRRGLIQEAVTAAGGNRSEAARQLGLSRQALSYLTRQLDID